MTNHDEIAEANADEECRAWIRKLIDARNEIVTVPTKVSSSELSISATTSTSESPRQLGPFIVTDFVEGTHLSKFLRQPLDDEYELAILNKDLDETILDTIYQQIADYMLQISRLSYPQIGAISRDNIHDAGPFRVFCDDMQPANMLVDPDTLRITVVLDLEFTNSLPAQFAYDAEYAARFSREPSE